MSVKIANNLDTGGLGINSDHEAQVGLNKDYDKSGFSLGGAEINSAGEGIGRVVRPSDISNDFRTRVGIDSTLYSDTFSHGTFNVTKYKGVDTTMTKAFANGRLVFNSGNSVTSGHATIVQTWAYFKLVLSSTVYVDFELMFSQVPQLGNVCEFGLGLATGVAAPTDAILFRLNAAGIMEGIINNNGSETAVTLRNNGVDHIPTPVNMNHYLIVLHNDRTEFWVDDVCMGAIVTPAALGSPCLSMSLPLMMREYNKGIVTTAQRMEVSNVSVTSGDQNINKLWATTMAIQGQSAVNAPDGAVSGQTANYANSAAPATIADAAYTNILAGYATKGGQFALAAVAGAKTDRIVFAYLNPAGTASIPGKNLIVRGIRIDTFNMGAIVATTPTVMQWGVGFGSSAITLATVDSATAGTCAARREVLGVQFLPVGAVIGQVCDAIDINFDAPECVEPGTYLHILVKFPVGTATASQVLRGTVFINGYFE